MDFKNFDWYFSNAIYKRSYKNNSIYKKRCG
nr:MAG TPA: hypothetical protein [Caudoviricetes sp.]